MGRRKIEVKRIEDKNTRQVTFSKRRSGLAKKARYLSVLCDVDIAGIIFSSRGKLYEFSTGSSSVEQIISRYQEICLEAKARITAGAGGVAELPSQCTRSRTCNELLEAVTRHVEGPKAEELNITDLIELEEELNAALMQTRSRKTQLMMQYISNLHDKEKKLREEKEQMEEQVASAMTSAKGDDGSARLNQMNPPRPLTLALFPG